MLLKAFQFQTKIYPTYTLYTTMNAAILCVYTTVAIGLTQLDVILYNIQPKKKKKTTL